MPQLIVLVLALVGAGAITAFGFAIGFSLGHTAGQTHQAEKQRAEAHAALRTIA